MITDTPCVDGNRLVCRRELRRVLDHVEQRLFHQRGVDPDRTKRRVDPDHELRGGLVTMHAPDSRTDQLIDTDPRDPFDFFPARYKAQLVAGYSKNTAAQGLKTYMPDFDDVRAARR